MSGGPSAADVRGVHFHVAPSTRVEAARGVTDRIGRWTASYGSRALIVTGQQHARASGLFERVDGTLRAEGIATEWIEGISANPTASIIDAGGLLARTWRADVIVAVGGGSVIDAAKAIATSARADEVRPFREHLSGLRPAGLRVDDALPVVALPTLPGSASETNGTSVITDDQTGRKLSAHSELAAPRVALLDPDLAGVASPEMLAPGLADAVCHALEAGLSSSSNVASDAYAEQALRTLMRLMDAPMSLEQGAARARALLEAWWASNFAGRALTLAGSIATHPLSHPISAHLDVRHGEVVAALEPAVLVVFADQFAQRGSLSKVARWLDVRGHVDPDAALRGTLGRLARYCGAVGLRSSLADFGVDADGASLIVRDARASGSRGLINMGDEPTVDELFHVVDLARLCGPTTTAKRVLTCAQELPEASACAGSRNSSPTAGRTKP